MQWCGGLYTSTLIAFLLSSCLLINVSQLQASTSPSQKDNKKNPIILIQVRGGSRHIIQAMQVEPIS